MEDIFFSWPSGIEIEEERRFFHIQLLQRNLTGPVSLTNLTGSQLALSSTSRSY